MNLDDPRTIVLLHGFPFNRSMWNARVSSKADAEPGRRIQLAVDPTELYFFDPETGASLTVGAPAAASVG